jgi:hypothetical protein
LAENSGFSLPKASDSPGLEFESGVEIFDASGEKTAEIAIKWKFAGKIRAKKTD